jgi:glycine betaine catabolism B
MTDKTATPRAQPVLSSLPPRWNSDTDGELVCCAVRDETHDVKSFLFRTVEPRSFRYEPGQFITLELTINGQQINRCYTLSSAPTRPDTVSITVKRKPGGSYRIGCMIP